MTEGLHIITGAPGAGKTSIVGALGDGITVVAEPARAVLAEWRSQGNPRPAQMEANAFVGLLLEASITNYEAARRFGGPVVFDRGVPDCVAYATHLGVDPAAALRATADLRYSPVVLVARPWEEIYSTDDERTMSFDLTVRFQDALDTAYKDAGYEQVEIPLGPVGVRADFVREALCL
jgi:predicted ATPase